MSMSLLTVPPIVESCPYSPIVFMCLCGLQSTSQSLGVGPSVQLGSAYALQNMAVDPCYFSQLNLFAINKKNLKISRIAKS